MHLTRSTCVCLAASLGVWLAAPALADDPPADESETPSLDESLHNEQPPFYVHAEVNRTSHEYREGDTLSIRVASGEDAYLYVQYQQADGQVFQIFPNQFQSDNRVKARQAVDIPGRDDLFRWVIGPPFGKEVIKVIASKEPLDLLSDPQMRAKRFNPVSVAKLKGVELELGQEAPTQWAEFDLEIVTRARSDESSPPGSRRFGVFFGVSQYEFDEEAKTASGGERGMNLSVAHRDAQTLGRTMQELGDVGQVKILTNADATRANLEEALTRWLPSVSRPGDTVFIFFSGHGGQIPDDNGDESDQLDEYILPHDFVSTGVLNVLLEQQQRGELTPQQASRVEQLVQVYRNAGDRGPEAVVRTTGVSDDLFGRWLQRLAGRQVIVVLDTCHSGGFATHEKGVPGEDVRGSFDFLDGEVGRLKDIGDSNQAILSAALAAEYAYERTEHDLGVLTYFLIEAMRGLPGPVRIEQAHQHCDQRMSEYFSELRRQVESEGGDPPAPAHPHLINNCTTPVLVKP